MGNQTSKNPGQEIYKAVEANDRAKLQRILHALIGAQRLTREPLQWTDSDGRTPLILAASKNLYHVAGVLLNNGADVDYVNTKCNSFCGTALHEATRKGHEAMVDLLLNCGSSPFLANAAGKTSMDEAMSKGSSNLLRRFEQLATWRGTLEMKVNKLGGLTQPYKSRYLVVVPFICAPVGSTPRMQRMQLWVYRDPGANAPKCRLWIDGASAVRMNPNDIILRLHPSHKPPGGDLAWRYDRGYCLSLRVADATVAAAASLSEFEAVVNRATAAATAVGRLPQAYPVIPTIPSFSSSSVASVTPSVTTTPSGSGGGGVNAQAMMRTSAPSSSVAGNGVSITGVSASYDFSEYVALPGESDSEFAQRLASAIAAQTADDPPDMHARTSHPSQRATSPPSAGPNNTTRRRQPAASTVTDIDRTIVTVPSAPPLSTPEAAVPSAATADVSTTDDSVCVICMSAPCEVGYLHGDSLHRCVCRSCCSSVRVGGNCPVCRQPVERIINVYN